MMKSLLLALLLAVPTIASCAPRDFTWKNVATGDGMPSTFLWRNANELWATGGKQVLRRIGGRWERMELCGGAKLVNGVSVAFEGETVWALCDSTLIRFESETSAKAIGYPNDGSVALMPLAVGFVLVGQTRTFAWNGQGFDVVVAYDKQEGAPTCGRTPQELYRFVNGVNERWDGSAWTPVELKTENEAQTYLPRCTYRGGNAWVGAYKIVGNTLTKAAGNADSDKRKLSFASPIDDTQSLWFGNKADVEGAYGRGTSSADSEDKPAAKAFLWLADRSSDEAEFLGGAPMNFGGLYGGSGTSAIYAIDASHVLLVVGTSLMEGSL